MHDTDILRSLTRANKTVQMLGTMVKNRPHGLPPWDMQARFGSAFVGKGKSREVISSRLSGERRTTLVLAPASLLQQARFLQSIAS